MDNISDMGDRESFEGSIVPNAAFDLSNYEANKDYFFVAYRLLSWFPVINIWGKTYYPEDISVEVLDTLTGSEVDLFHDQSKIVGIVITSAITPDGLDVLIRLKRSAIEAHNLEVEDVVQSLNKCSLELRKSPELSDYLVLNDDLSVDRTISSISGIRSGMRPTSQNDDEPFLFRGRQRVVERVRPIRFTGVGLLSNPADKTALGYGIVASDDMPETPVAPVHELAGESEHKDTHMDLEQAMAALADANAKLAVYETEKASALSEVETLKAETASLKTQVDSLNTELASATQKAGALQSAEDARIKVEKTAEIFNQFSAILAPDSDEDKALYQERAAAACDDHGVVREFTLDLREKKLAQAEAAQAAPAETPAPEVPVVNDPPAETQTETEQASAGNTPAVSIAPGFDGGDKNKGASSDNLWLLA